MLSQIMVGKMEIFLPLILHTVMLSSPYRQEDYKIIYISVSLLVLFLIVDKCN